MTVVLTSSNMPELGLPAPDFVLPDTDGRLVKRDDFADAKALLVVFWCNHCPYVKHIRQAFAAFAREFKTEDLAVVAINSNDGNRYPADKPEGMSRAVREFGYTFPYLFDETQDVAKAYQAACTPDFFLYDHERKLIYRGQFDASRPGNNIPVTGEDLRHAVDAVLSSQEIPREQIPGIGCNIKWKPGNEPA